MLERNTRNGLRNITSMASKAVRAVVRDEWVSVSHGKILTDTGPRGRVTPGVDVDSKLTHHVHVVVNRHNAISKRSGLTRY